MVLLRHGILSIPNEQLAHKAQQKSEQDDETVITSGMIVIVTMTVIMTVTMIMTTAVRVTVSTVDHWQHVHERVAQQ